MSLLSESLTQSQICRFWGNAAAGPGGCIIWTACTNRAGYGKTSFHKRGYLAHRAAYELVRGPIPSGLQLDHLCRVKRCLNPHHLEAVTPAENLRRSDAALGRRTAATACPSGHEYDDANTYYSAEGWRCCRECNRLRAAENYRNRKRT